MQWQCGRYVELLEDRGFAGYRMQWHCGRYVEDREDVLVTVCTDSVAIKTDHLKLDACYVEDYVYWFSVK